MSLLPMVGYQGGKRRVAARIAQEILRRSPSRVYDLGVGSGAVTLALLDAGVSPARITAVDAGPWGDVWAALGAGTFDVRALATCLRDATTRDPTDVKRWIELELATRPYSPEVFVVMQAASFGASPVWHDGTRWRCGDGQRGYCARGYWTPGFASVETKPLATLFAPQAIVARAARLVLATRGLDGRRARAEDLALEPGAVAYLDPPYAGTGGYGYAMDWRSVVARHRPALVSEGIPLADATTTHELAPRKGAALRSSSRGRSPEYLNVYEAEVPR